MTGALERATRELAARQARITELEEARAQDAVHLADLQRAHVLLELLCDASRLLTGFRSVEDTLPALVALVARALSLRTAIFVVESAGTARTVVWLARGARPQRLQAARARARIAYGYLVRSGTILDPEDTETTLDLPPDPTDAGEADETRFVILPLVVGRGPIFGVLQLEGTGSFEERDLVCINTVVNQLAVAVDPEAARHRNERDGAPVTAHDEFRSVLTAIPDGIAVLRDGRIHFANPAFLAMVRSDETRVLGKPYLDFVHPDDQGRLGGETPARGSREQTIPLRMIPCEGPLRVAEISTADAVSFDGVPATILLSRDTTDHRFDRELHSRAKHLSALGALGAGIAHEINNPLASVLLNLERLRERGTSLDPDALEAVREGIGGAERIRGVMSELLGAVGPDGPGPPVPVDVVRVVNAAVNLTRNELRHRARLVQEHTDDAFVLAREGALVQVLVNVLANAAAAIGKAGDGARLIRIGSRIVGGNVEISVADSGIGIPEAARQRLFEPFSTTCPGGPGSGLGLAIGNRIIDGLGGEIRIDSTLGLGTTVTVVLPSAVPPPRLVPPHRRGSAPGPRRALGCWWSTTSPRSRGRCPERSAATTWSSSETGAMPSICWSAARRSTSSCAI